MDKYLHWYEAFWGKAQKQIHEGLGPKWKISYHCGDMWCPQSLHDRIAMPSALLGFTKPSANSIYSAKISIYSANI